MRRFVILAAIAALAFSSVASAQLAFGIHGTASFASYSNYDENLNEVTSWAPGFSLGATVTYDLTDFATAIYDKTEKFLVRGNVGYSMFNPASDEYDIFGTKFTFDYTLSALYIEALAQYYVNEKVYGMLGLGIMPYMMDVTVTPTIGAVTAEGETKVGPIIGAGYQLNDHIGLELFAGNSHIRAGALYLF